VSNRMDEPIRLQEEPDYFGGCPLCGGNDGYLNVGAAHWFYCQEHATRWCAGANLFSGWRQESEECWRKNAENLARYVEVEPLMPSWCCPISKEEWDQELRDEGWIEESPGVWRNPNVVRGVDNFW
jgi:hypothetical protein